MKEQLLHQVDTLLGQFFSSGKVTSVSQAERVLSACNRIKSAFSDLSDMFPDNVAGAVQMGDDLGIPPLSDFQAHLQAQAAAMEQAETKYSAD